MSHFLGTPARKHLWALAEARGNVSLAEAKYLRKRLLSGPTVDIYVGRDKKHWSLHQNLLCHHSSYFETEFQGHEVPKKKHVMKENKLELLDDDPRGFELLVKWLYQGHLEDVSQMSDEDKYDYAVACHKLYQLCDKFDMIALKNLAMDVYRQNLNAAQLVPDADEINEIYRASPPGSPFRRLMTKIAARQIMDPAVDKDAESYRACFSDNPNFAVEMVNAIRYMSGGMLFDDPTADDPCPWHDHRDGSSCKDGKGKGRMQMVNGVKGRLIRFEHVMRCARRVTCAYRVKGLHPHQLNTPAKIGQPHPPLAELSARPTPRKLNVPQQSPVRARSSFPKGAMANGAPATPTRAVSFSFPQSARRPPKLHQTPGKRSMPNGVPNHVTDSARRVVSSPTKPTANGIHKRPDAMSFESNKHVSPPNSSHGSVNGHPVRTSSLSNGHSNTTGGPRKADQVNGIVPKMNGHLNGVNGVNGVASESGSQSVGGASEEMSPEKKLPPKLKRKAPG